MVGIYPSYATAFYVWRTASQNKSDNAHMRYFIVHTHRRLDPDNDPEKV